MRLTRFTTILFIILISVTVRTGVMAEVGPKNWTTS